MTTRRPRLSVVCPCCNEAEVIEQFHQQLSSALDAIGDLDCEIVFVDDGSTDETLAILNALARRDGRVRVFALSRNFGHQVALTAGLDVAAGDAVIMMDSDLQHPPALIGRMVQLWREGNDVVSAVRRDTQNLSFAKRLGSGGFYWLLNRLTRQRIVAGAADFCLLSRRAHEALGKMPERHRFLRGMVSWIGFKRAFVQYEAPDRPGGKSKYTFRRKIHLASDAILSFSTAGITAAAWLGLITVVLGCVYLAVILYRYIFYGDLVRGWASLISVVLIVGGLILAFLGILGQYVARVFEEVKHRPLYFFKQTPQDAPRPEGKAADALDRPADEKP